MRTIEFDPLNACVFVCLCVWSVEFCKLSQSVNLFHIIFDSTVLGVSGEDFAIVAGDSRMSVGYSISSRSVPKTHEL